MVRRDTLGKFIKGSVSPRYQNLYKSCFVCGTKFKTVKSQFKRRQCCSRKCALQLNPVRSNTGGYGKSRNLMKSGYWRIFFNGQWIYEHRYIMEQILGRPLKSNEAIHHKDGDRKNNSPFNLELIKKKEHDRMETQRRWDKNIFHRRTK